MPTYSFLDVNATLVGPGGSIPLGNSAGVAEEGIEVEMLEEKDLMTIGADGSAMHSLNASKAARITVRLLKTSPTNQQLSQMYALQAASSAAWGLNVFSITNPISGDSITGANAAFTQFPRVSYAKNPAMNEWRFNVGNLDTSLGGGLLENLASFGVGLT